MKIHGTAKGGAESKKDFGVAFSAAGGGSGCFFDADFSSTSGWTEMDDTYIDIDTATEQLDVNCQTDGSIDNAYYTLSEALSESAWNLRWTFHFTTITGDSTPDSGWQMSLARQGNLGGNCYNGCVSGLSGDSVGASLKWNIRSGGKNRAQFFSTGGSASLGTNDKVSAGNTYYMEIIYDDGDCTFNLREDDFTTSPIETLTTSGSALTEIDTVAIRNDNATASGTQNTLIGYITEIKINNGSTDPC